MRTGIFVFLVALCAFVVTPCCEKETRPVIPVVPSKGPFNIFMGQLADGLDMGVNSSGGLTDWLIVDGGVMEMKYPAGQSWGAVFITVGEPKDPPRPGEDLSAFTRLSLDIRGETGGETVWVAVKDNTDPDNGTEARVRIHNITTEWVTRKEPLSQFYTADFDSIYSPLLFVFDGGSKTIYVRNVRYLR